MTNALLVGKLEKIGDFMIFHRLESDCDGLDLHQSLARSLHDLGKLTCCFPCFEDGIYTQALDNPVRVYRLSDNSHQWNRDNGIWFQCKRCKRRLKLNPGRENMGLSLGVCNG